MAQAYVERKKVVITGGDPYAIDVSGNSKIGVVTDGTWNGSSVGVSFGGTGANNVTDARTNLGLSIGSNVQAYSETLNSVSNGTYSGDDSIVTVGTVTTGTWNASTVGVAYGGTGANTLTGYVKANGTNAMTANSMIPVEDISGFSNSVSNLVSTSLEVDSGLSLVYDSANDKVVIAISDNTLLSVANGTYSGDDSIVTVGTVTTGTWNGSVLALAYGGVGANNASDARTNLGLIIGTNVQAYNATLDSVSNGTYSGDDSIVTVGTVTTGTWNAGVVAVTYGGTGANNNTDARTNLGLGSIATQNANNVSITGGTLSGITQLDADNLRLDGNTLSSTDANGDIVLSPNGTGVVKIGVNEVATKAYVDANSQGLDVKLSVRASTMESISLSGLQTVDGVSLVAGDRVLVKNQSTASENGIYVVVDGGAWTRSDDANASVDVTAGMFTFVEEGTTQADTGWVLITNNPINLGSTGLSFSQFNGAGSLIAGNGLTQTGNQIDVVGTASRISVTNNSVDIANDYVGQSTITTLGTVTTGTWNASLVSVTYGGTGANNASDARTNLGLVIGSNVQAYNATLDSVSNGTYSGDDSIVTVGTVTTGTWNASLVSVTYGGTGANNASDARKNLGLAIGINVQAYNATLDSVSNGTYSGDDSIVTVGTVTTGTWNAGVVAVTYGGTGANNNTDARTNLGLGSIATQNANNVSITGGTLSGITELSVSGFNSGLTLATDTYSNAKVAVRTPVVNFKTVAETSVFTVPSGYMFMIDTMEVVSTSVSGPSVAPEVRFGNAADGSAYYAPATTLSNGVGARHVIDIPQDAVAANTVVTFGISTVSTATSHSGFGVVTGYLVKL